MSAIRSLEAQPYWDALCERRLVIQQCESCGKHRHYPQPMCPHCHSLRVQWTQASGKGSIHSWTVTHSTKLAGFTDKVPYTIATIDLEEGVRMAAPLRHDPGLALHIGLPVELIFEEPRDDLVLPAFVPAQKQETT